MTPKVYQPLSVNTNYILKVTSVASPRKFGKSDSPLDFYSFKVELVDRSGKEYIAEYVTTSPTQDAFIVGRETELFVSLKGRFCDEIKPGKLHETDVSNGTGTVKQTIRASAASGQTYTFAMGYAKDIFCEMIKAGHVKVEEGHVDLEELLIMAKQINGSLIDMQIEQTANHS